MVEMKEFAKNWLTTDLKKLFTRLFEQESSKVIAKDRLKLILIHDRTQVDSEKMEALRSEIIEVISKYLEVDHSKLNIQLVSEKNSIALVASVPVQGAQR